MEASFHNILVFLAVSKVLLTCVYSFVDFAVSGFYDCRQKCRDARERFK